MLILINQFNGTAPRLDAEQLADGLAVEATNVNFSETLQGWCAPLSLNDSVPALSEYLYHYADAYWFSWQSPTYAVADPLQNDPFQTVIISDNQYPKVTRLDVAIAGSSYPNTTYRLGVPIPDPPTLLVEINDQYAGLTEADNLFNENDLDLFTTSYKVLFVDNWGRVGATSLPSQNVDIKEYDGEMMLKVTVTLPPVPPGHPLIANNAKWYIFRFNNSVVGTGVYQFLVELPITATQYVDRTISADLQEALQSEDWLGPPDDDVVTFPNGPLQHICSMSEAFLCGHNAKMVCFSEPEVSHAWPSAYYMIFSEKLIRTVNYGSDVVLLTDDHPYILSGVHPESVSRIRLAKPAPAINPEAVCEVAGSVLFAGKRGLYEIRGNEVGIVSESAFTTKEWRALQPQNMRFVRHEDLLMMRLFDGRIIVYDPTKPEKGFGEVALESRALHTDLESEALIFTDNTGALFEFDAHATNYLPITYESKHFRLHNPMNMYCARVRANRYPVDVEIVSERRNGETYSYTKSVADDTFFYIPTKSDTVEWYFRVAGDVDIRSLGLSTSIQELNSDV